MRLVLSPVEPGNVRIRAGAAEVGHALTEWDSRDPRAGAWRAYLWSAAGLHDAGWEPTGKFLRLRDLRAELQRRLDEEGPWWKP